MHALWVDETKFPSRNDFIGNPLELKNEKKPKNYKNDIYSRLSPDS